jgi:hypothetical protein
MHNIGQRPIADTIETVTEEAFTIGSELEPGTYTSQVATPVSFTVPAGWKVFEDEPGQFGLARMANDEPPLLVLRDIDGAAKDHLSRWGSLSGRRLSSPASSICFGL